MDEELIENFRVESEEHLEVMEAELAALEKISDPLQGEVEIIERLNSAFRAAHSLKGAAVFLAFKNITDVTHAMESILGELRDSVQVPGVDCANLLYDAVDVLAKLFDDIYESDKADIQGIVNKLNKFADITVAEETADGQEHNRAAVNNEEGLFEYSVVCSATKIVAELELIGEIKEKGTSKKGMCYIVESVLEPELFEVALCSFECDIVLNIKQENISERKEETVAVLRDSSEKTAPKNIKKSIDNQAEKKMVKPVDATVRVPVSLLDELMSLAGELVLVRNQHLRWVNEADDSKANEIASRLDTVTTELQTSILRTRMQPLDKVFTRLPRIVRDITRVLKKKIKLEFVGKEVEVDKTILESIVDPLTHLLRNSCDHGIEMPDIREANGKNEVGTITVSAVQESGRISIIINDDGKGIDPDVIGNIALTKHMVTEQELLNMNDQDKIGLIMLPGFSTAESVSNISGRGVGMDVVKSSIEKLGGTFDITSEVGVGTKFVLSLPLTLAIIQSLVIAEGEYKYLIPRINLEEVISLVGNNIPNRIKVVNGQEVLNYHSSLLQLVCLNEVFMCKKTFDAQKREEISTKYENLYLQSAGNPETLDSLVVDIAVVRVGQKRFGLVIDKALETEEIVVKPLHPAQGEIKIFLGSTIMGDGATSLILDIDGIAKHALSEVHYVEKEQTQEHNMVHSEMSQKVLIFSTGAVEQYSLALSFIRRIYTINSKDIQSIGGQEFVQIGDKSINVARLEKVLEYGSGAENIDGELYLIMPRFGSYNCGIVAATINGIADMVIDFEDSMLQRSGVLGTTLVDGRLTVFPDIYYICERVLGADAEALSLKLKKLRIPKKVLVVEDTPFFRQLIKTYLTSDSLEVDTACNGKEALELLEDNEYDLLLSDIEMPIMNGLELIREVRSSTRFKNIPAISLTSLNTDDDKRKCIQAGYDNYLAKLNREEFHEVINKIFNN